MVKGTLIFGLSDFPRPKGLGFFYYRLSPKGVEHPLITFDLFETDKKEFKEIMHQGIQRYIHKLKISPENIFEVFQDYQTKNMKEWSESILREVIQEFCEKGTDLDHICSL